MKNQTKKILTLCIIHQHPKVLLGMKKRGFGEGRWNGFGGKVQDGETIEEATKREMKEEAGVEVSTLTKMGVLDFSAQGPLRRSEDEASGSAFGGEFYGNPEVLEVHIFKAEDFSGALTESEEMKPQWFHVDEIPFASMWPDDKHWFPLFLKNKRFRGKFLFGESDAILGYELKEI
ncbi:MAG: 8-oxo-dGTP diphosphatase [bacterium]|nr:8-oxo-dGTP diphosphatase [bacterium]